MNKRSYFLFAIAAVTIFGIIYILLKTSPGYLSRYLSKSEQVKADILVVEGWLPHYAIEAAYNEYQKNRYKHVVTTGTRYIPSYYKISDNGYLIFYTSDLLSELNETGYHSIDIKAYSDLGGEDQAHFNLFINDSLKASFFAHKRKKRYSVKWYGCLKDIDSIMVQYDNDIYEPPLDRNLSVKEICFDNKITVPYLYYSEYDMLKLDGKLRYRNNITSTAQAARTRLMKLGMDSTRITAVTSEKIGNNRTLTSALAFRNWLIIKNKELDGINIISLGIHGRRTWMTYNKILDEKYRIGIISIPEENNMHLSPSRKVIRTMRETLGIIYYWLILIPY